MRRLWDRLSRSHRIADIGGGTGVIGMYLATANPGCEVTIYDHFPAQLVLGRRWAEAQSLRHVRCTEATYEQLADQKGPANHDLVLFLRGMDMRLPSPNAGTVSLEIPNGIGPGAPVTEPCRFATGLRMAPYVNRYASSRPL
ncbi:class I SAM-dependent methyltransferase [Gemmata sp. G18]|uniref:Class I SAM-dependent methyltransferase n=1 Tax=Gemmata palustris TaxID=2822762 RepID=A0ABS5BVP1_9BACT|nr:class I SAM-dependent methyltransferase [Gemmata palustris]